MNIHTSEIEDAIGLIEVSEYSVDDFIIGSDLSQSPHKGNIQKYQGYVSIRCISIRVSKLYPAGHQINWLEDFENDLRSKIYG